MTKTTVTFGARQIDLDAARMLMDDDLCEQIHGLVTSEQDFFDAYLLAHADKYGQPFEFG